MGASFVHGCTADNPMYYLATKYGFAIDPRDGGYGQGNERICLFLNFVLVLLGGERRKTS